MFLPQLALMAQKRKIGLHLLLVIGIVSYVYSPILDHWLDRGYYARPHIHISLPENIVSETVDDHFLAHGDHEENTFCLLDVRTLICVLLNVNVVLIVQDAPLNFGLPFYYTYAATIYLPVVDPPPRIHT